ncbi:hypothetical protein [Serinicoccus sp. CUA-874]|uniref:hypothetical protein n=1 Tax=Serinicoccus sp. CUA-874 TaxID=1517939 RepID=UPI001EDAAF84|nr:hypothetical protein [Serinicoccus sp. CUA-874]
MTGTLSRVRDDVLALVPDLGAWWYALALAPLLLAAVMLLVVGRWPEQPGHRAVHRSSVAAALVSALGVAGVALDRPVVEVSWIPSLGVWFTLRPDGLSVPLLLLTAVVGVVATALHLHPAREARTVAVDLEDSDPTSPIPVVRGVDVPGLASYHACLLLVLLGALLAFLAGDALLFFVASSWCSCPCGCWWPGTATPGATGTAPRCASCW